MIKECAVKKCSKTLSQMCVRQLIDKKYCVIFLDFVIFAVFVSFFKFEIFSDALFILNKYSLSYLISFSYFCIHLF
jgi:hypothetical protein